MDCCLNVKFSTRDVENLAKNVLWGMVAAPSDNMSYVNFVGF
jgi:hypothetical protein